MNWQQQSCQYLQFRAEVGDWVLQLLLQGCICQLNSLLALLGIL